LRVSNALYRESKKLLIRNTKESKEESKKRRTVLSDKNKIRAQYRKDFSSELKRIRGDANISVLQFFDEEEDREERDQHIKHSLTNSSSSSSSSSSSFSSPSKNGPKVPKGSETPKDLKSSINSASQIPDKFVEKDERMREVFKSLPTCSESFFGQSSSGYNSVTSSLLSSSKSRIKSDNNDFENGINDDNKKDTMITVHNKNFNGIDNKNENMHENRHENENEVMNWDDVFQTINCLYTFSDFLQLQMSVKINSFVSKIARISNINNSMSNSLRSVASSSNPKGIDSDIPNAGNDSESIMDIVTENNGSENTKNNDNKNSVAKIEKGSEMKMDVVRDESNDGKEKNSKKGDKNEKLDEEDEWDENEDHTKRHNTDSNLELKTDSIDNNDDNDNDENSVRNNKGLLEAHADLDRVHLCLVHALATDLHTLLDLDETDKGLAVKFPLNQV
jgi:hypothetical protein